MGLIEFVVVIDDKSKFLLHNSIHANRVKRNGMLEIWAISERRTSLRVVKESVIWNNGRDSYLLDSIIELEDR